MDIIAHRGFSGAYPENTMLSFQKAVEYGADGIELDVHLSKDGELMIIHDESLKRTTGIDGFVFDYTRSELERINAGKTKNDEFGFTPIPSLEEYLSMIKGTGLYTNIELKTAPVCYPGIEEKTIDKMVTSFFDGCRLVLRLNGESAGPWLASHRSPPPFDPELRIWTPDDEDILIEMAERRMGWQRIADTIGVSSRVARHRHRMIMDARKNEQCENPSALPGIGELQWDDTVFEIPDDLTEFLELLQL